MKWNVGMSETLYETKRISQPRSRTQPSAVHGHLRFLQHRILMSESRRCPDAASGWFDVRHRASDSWWDRAYLSATLAVDEDLGLTTPASRQTVPMEAPATRSGYGIGPFRSTPTSSARASSTSVVTRCVRSWLDVVSTQLTDVNAGLDVIRTSANIVRTLRRHRSQTKHRASTEHSLTFRVRTVSSYRGADASL